MAQQIQLRRGTASQWTSVNPILAQGEPGVEIDTGKLKIGDGSTAWASLPYASAADASTGSKGLVQLAGDLAGTAASPTVPGLAGKAAAARVITAGTGLTGGGDLSADRTLTVTYGTTSGTAAQGNDSRIVGALQASNNLSDVTAATARTNLGLGAAATQPTSAFDAAGAAATAQAASLQKTSNLSDLASPSAARTSLGLGGAAVMSTAQVAADSALTTAFVQPPRLRKSLPAPFVGAYGGIGKQQGTAGVAGGYTARFLHTIATAVSEIRLVVPVGWYISVAGDTLNTQAVPVTATVEIGSTSHPVTFSGQKTLSVAPGGMAVSDPIAVELAAGATLYTRTYIGIASGEKWIEAMPSLGPGAATTGSGFTSGSDTTASTGAMTSSSASATWTPSIIGTPTAGASISVGAIGDSITDGTGDTGGGSSWISRATNATVPLTRLAISSLQLTQVRGNPKRSLPFIANCTHVVVLIGTNDLANSSRSFAQLQGDSTWLFNYLAARGVKVYGATMLPRTTSTDSWATTGNQTPVTGMAAGGASNRGLYNAWIRGGAGGLLNGYLELADAVESARDSGAWTPGLTADGIHPNSTGHAAIAAVAATWLGTLTAL